MSSVAFNKPYGLKYTDMAIYVDEHFPDVIDPFVNPEVESRIYEYIYHLIYMLAYKQGYFTDNMDMYDDFALYGAQDVFMSLRWKLQHKGENIHGRLVTPVKSILNYLKADLYPLKVEYLKGAYREVFDPNLHNNIEVLELDIKKGIQQQYSLNNLDCYTEAFNELPNIINYMLDRTPFKCDKVMRRKLYISIMLTFIDQLTLPSKLRKQVDKKIELNSKVTYMMEVEYLHCAQPAIIWHMDEEFNSYVKLLYNKCKKRLSDVVRYLMHVDDLSDDELNQIISTAYATYDTREDTPNEG